MPGVALLPNSPGSGGFGTSHSTAQNGVSRPHDDLSVAEIKTRAKETVQKEGRGASCITLIRTARTQILSAKECEAKGDLKNALSSYIKAASLTRMAMDSTEFMQDSKGAIRREWNDLIESDARDLTARSSAVEEKLKAIERSQATDPPTQSDGPIVKSGGSIADRVRALQDNGLTVGTSSKRFSREVSNLPTPPISPTRISTVTQPPPPSIMSTMVPSTPVSPSPHTLVSPSSFGPPSPSSSPSSSPQLDISGFSQTFPSIDELDGNPAFSLPSVPQGISNDQKPPFKDVRNGESSASPLTSFRNFAVPIERPSSTPITPMGNDFASRPASPTRSTAPLKPSGLYSNITPSSGSPKTPLPVRNTALPKDLYGYIRDYNVLLIDVRNREDFEREHIKASAVVCVEPTVLLREGVNAETLENSMVVAPRHEVGLFGNRDKFDLVAVYDGSSTSFGDSSTPLSTLVRIINEQAFRKMLKRMPMILVGGLEAWKRDLGVAELVRGDASLGDVQRSSMSPEPPKQSPPSFSSPNPNNPFTNGMLTSYISGGGINGNSIATDPHQVWNPRQRPDALPLNGNGTGNGIAEHRPTYSLDTSGHSRSPADYTYSPSTLPNDRGLARRPAIARPNSSSISFSRSKGDTPNSPIAPPQINGAASTSSIIYPSFPRRISPTSSGSGVPLVPPPSQYDIASPPQASINSSQLSRRRSDYVDQSQEALSTFHSRGPIDYPELTSAQVVRPPPIAASPALERQDNRPRLQQVPSLFTPTSAGLVGPKPPRINSDYPVTYWADLQIGTSGLKNLGNTCYMNAPIQCLSATVPFARFFTDGRWKTAINYTNNLGSKGKLATAFAELVHEMWGGDFPYLTPIEFRRSICHLKSQYIGSDQHDSQEFLSFMLDGIHEDLNRVMMKPQYSLTPEQEAELERLPPQIASDREWRAWRSRNDSLIVDFFQGQFRNRLQCLTCNKTSTTYNVFSILQLPIPHSRSSKVPIERCLDAFFNEEVLEKDDAWDCPRCKVKRRASKKLSLARLPPILLIHFKRFEANGRFSDKIDTFVEFPMKSLDLTNYMPPPLPPGIDKSELNGGLPMSPDDPRTQLPPYRYDLYGVTNHYGNLSSGHYTAFIASRGGWMLCDDSSVKATDPKHVVNQKAYVLFYKRVRA